MISRTVHRTHSNALKSATVSLRQPTTRLSEKGKKHLVTRRVVRLPLSQQSVHGHASLVPRVAALAERYLATREAAHSAQRVSAGHGVPEFLLQLPGEPPPQRYSKSNPWGNPSLLG